ncbi:hypothetical protein Dsin_029219 [Dipteronia sinensis]|uniref:Reverse transcriptase domain-containing protein n=1 Tax=Dipteronia sinensis TaxID=43782 RepID=A0AAD9ZRX9_9ROSI|nr:hypothetical protein Dsin_029219 [Dipteronia sinensis]
MQNVSKVWKEARVVGSKGFVLFSKMKASKLIIKKGLAAKEKVTVNTQELVNQLALVDKKAINDGWSVTLRQQHLSLMTDLWREIRREEQKWKQPSRVKWLKEGDMNSNFFHWVVNGRRCSNYIGELVFDGEKISDPDLVKSRIHDFFKEHFKTVTWQRPKISSLGVKLLSSEERRNLEIGFNDEEDDFMSFLTEFHKNGEIVGELNNTFIALILKCKAPLHVKDFRPISLVGSLYKVLAKVLATRLQSVMNSVIGESQMAFVKHRQILNGFVVAEEIIHKWKRDKERGLVVKLDFKKAYDSVDHRFLVSMMIDMGFGSKWRGWIRSCISSPMLSILVNGSPTPRFRVERGLRQGDPLSPFLFNIVVKGMNCLFQKAHAENLMEGATFGDNLLHISHLQFTDDTILFLQPKIEYLRNVRRILRCFELASGLRINFHKSSVTRVGIFGVTHEEWSEAFRCKSVPLPITYLGLPLGARPCSILFWKEIIIRIENRLAPWKRRFLSKGGRLVLIKSVLSSLPSYFMAVFKMPVAVAAKIEKLQRSFFWGDGQVKRKMHLVNWSSMCKSKSNGGLGIDRMLDKNKALLAKWIWRFGKEDNSLWKKVICARYGLLTTNLSWKWHSSSMDSFFVKVVNSLIVEGSFTATVLKEGMKTIVGCVALRRPIFDWEKDQWRSFITCLDSIAMRKHLPDEVVWTFCPQGSFLVASFRRQLENSVDKGEDESTVKGIAGAGGDWGEGGGVLRDSNGKVLCLFSSPIGIQLPITAEIFAIRRACQLCLSKECLRWKKIVIICDSSTTVEWINEEGFGNIEHISSILDIIEVQKEMGNISIQYNSRITNSFADALAKMAFETRMEKLEWSLD